MREPCAELEECRQAVQERISDMEGSIDSIKDDVKAMREIIETWNNGKGFVNTIRILSKIFVWLGLTGSALFAIFQAIKHFGD